jgi:hypothetical protein
VAEKLKAQEEKAKYRDRAKERQKGLNPDYQDVEEAEKVGPRAAIANANDVMAARVVRSRSHRWTTRRASTSAA